MIVLARGQRRTEDLANIGKLSCVEGLNGSGLSPWNSQGRKETELICLRL